MRADDPGSGTWDHVEETWEFTHEQVRSVDDFVDEHGYMNYKEQGRIKDNSVSNIKTVSSSTENAGCCVCGIRHSDRAASSWGGFIIMIVYFSVILWLSFIYPVSILMLSENYNFLYMPQSRRNQGFCGFWLTQSLCYFTIIKYV